MTIVGTVEFGPILVVVAFLPIVAVMLGIIFGRIEDQPPYLSDDDDQDR